MGLLALPNELKDAMLTSLEVCACVRMCVCVYVHHACV